MTQDTAALAARRIPIPGAEERPTTSRLLAAGALAGPVFLGVALVGILTREGFDLARHPISALTLGDGGWVQSAAFVVSGLLVLAFASGARRMLAGGRGSTWAPRLLGLFGAGLVIAGVFVPDPAYGFPPGTPDGMPARLSTQAMVHGLGFMVAFGSLTAACLVVARRFATDGRPSWAAYTVASAVVAVALAGWPDQDGASVRYALASVVAFGWLTAMAARLIADLPTTD